MRTTKQKKIYDEVHGYIGLTGLEVEIIDTPYMQRLKNIKQLSIAYHVYPGATHTRFSHSIGALYIMGIIAENLSQQGFLGKDEIEMLRLAALLHDIGHYPYSHTVEEVYQKLYPNKPLSHEEVGVRIIIGETEIRDKILEAGFNPREIGEVILREHKNKLYNQLMGSDIDVDKIDYLLRDSKHTGVAYGNIDVQRLTQTVTVDDDGNLAFLTKGLEAVENLYIGRLHMYRSVYLHKTVTALELVLQQLIEKLHARNLGMLDVGELLNPTSRNYVYFDDNSVSTLVYVYALRGGDRELRTLAETYIYRRPPKLAFETYSLTGEDKNYELVEDLLKTSNLEELVSKAKIDGRWVYPYIAEVEVVGDIEAQARICPKPSSRSIPVTEADSIVKLLPRTLKVARIYCREGEAERLGELIRSKLEERNSL